MRYPELTLKLTTSLGANLHDTVKKAIKIARQLDVAVEFDWWDKNFVICPDDKLESWLERHKSLL